MVVLFWISASARFIGLIISSSGSVPSALTLPLFTLKFRSSRYGLTLIRAFYGYSAILFTLTNLILGRTFIIIIIIIVIINIIIIKNNNTLFVC